MNILKGIRSATSKKDNLIKQSIFDQLSSSVKEIQYASFNKDKSTNTSVGLAEATNTLCVTIEAIFLHGLKDSLAYRFKRAVTDVDERPEPSFWAPLLVISHRQIIDQTTDQSQITTEVGKCRAWIRFALNDSLLSSYLLALKQDSSVIKSFYRTEAYVRDVELLDVSQCLIESVEVFKSFKVPINSSLLNTWCDSSLFLAGVYSPTLKVYPVAPCDDVAQSIEDNKSEMIPPAASGLDTVSLCSALSLTSQSSRLIVDLTEDDVLKIILADKQKHIAYNNVQSCVDKSCSSDQEKTDDIESKLVAYSAIGNSLNSKTGWKLSENSNEKNSEEIKDFKVNKNAIVAKVNEPKSMEGSFNALIQSYNMLSGPYIKTPDIKQVWQKFEQERDIDETSAVLNEKKPLEENTAMVFKENLIKSQTISLVMQTLTIGREKGLDFHDFNCSDCKTFLGFTKKAIACSLTGDYFCNLCLYKEPVVIPARIIHNWDFKQYPISQKSFNYLQEVKDQPIIDFKVLNPYIYTMVNEMAELQILREQLHFLRAYLYACREPVLKEFQMQMWPREYMYEHIHQYSVGDLSEIKNGLLITHLQRVVNFGKEHVSSCWLCSQKGFVCEVCNKSKPLFPFDVDQVYRCNLCYSVYHKNCLNSLKPCPKCKRRIKRDVPPPLESL